MLSRRQNIKKISYRSKIAFMTSYASCRSYRPRTHLVSTSYASSTVAFMRCLTVTATSIVEASATPQQRDLADLVKCIKSDNDFKFRNATTIKIGKLLLYFSKVVKLPDYPYILPCPLYIQILTPRALLYIKYQRRRRYTISMITILIHMIYLD